MQQPSFPLHICHCTSFSLSFTFSGSPSLNPMFIFSLLLSISHLLVERLLLLLFLFSSVVSLTRPLLPPPLFLFLFFLSLLPCFLGIFSYREADRRLFFHSITVERTGRQRPKHTRQKDDRRLCRSGV